MQRNAISWMFSSMQWKHFSSFTLLIFFPCDPCCVCTMFSGSGLFFSLSAVPQGGVAVMTGSDDLMIWQRPVCLDAFVFSSSFFSACWLGVSPPITAGKHRKKPTGLDQNPCCRRSGGGSSISINQRNAETCDGEKKERKKTRRHHGEPMKKHTDRKHPDVTAGWGAFSATWNCIFFPSPAASDIIKTGFHSARHVVAHTHCRLFAKKKAAPFLGHESVIIQRKGKFTSKKLSEPK